MRDTKIDIPCIRCGVCCSSGVCPYGIGDDRGLCTYLIIDKYADTYITSCKLMFDNDYTPETMDIDGGCQLRKLPDVYQYYLEQMRNKLVMI